MSTITDSDENPVDLNGLFDTEVVRCANWEAEPEVCHPDCEMRYPRRMFKEHGWAKLAISYGWQVLMHRCNDAAHPIHSLPFCSLECLERWAAREKHLPHPEPVDS